MDLDDGFRLSHCEVVQAARDDDVAAGVQRLHVRYVHRIAEANQQGAGDDGNVLDVGVRMRSEFAPIRKFDPNRMGPGFDGSPSSIAT